MSYCRWSSDDYQCDAYVWHDVAGTWRTEIAGRRRVYLAPLPEPVNLPVGEANTPERAAWASAWVERSAAIDRLLDDDREGEAWEWLDLADPEGGHSYEHSTPGECADNLERLAALGFKIPQGAIDALREDDE